MLKGSLVLVFRNLTQRRVRTALTTLGVIIGIAAIVGLVSATQGISNNINAQLTKLQGDRILITPKAGMSFVGGGSTGGLTERDVDEIAGLSGVRVAYGQLQTSALVTYGGEAQSLAIVGVSPSGFEKLDTLGVDVGRYLSDSDHYSVVIGDSVAHEMYKKEVGVRKTVSINGTEFQVVGILNAAGGAFSTMDSSLIMPKEDMRNLFNMSQDSVNSIVVGVKSDASIADVADRISEALRKLHKVTEEQEDFTVITPEYISNVVGQITGLMSVLLGGIAGISLVVGTIGITNIMYVTVSERTREIGVMKAIGATNHDILFLFVLESGIISLIGGAIGAVVGLGLGEGILQIAGYAFRDSQVQAPGFSALQLHIAVLPELMLGVIALSFMVGVLAGFFPAKKAASLNPIEALRYE